MGILALAADERVAEVNVTNDLLSVQLMDGRTITVPLAWYPRLLNATEDQRNSWQISGGGYGIHWNKIDEDLSTEGLLRGAPAFDRNQSPTIENLSSGRVSTAQMNTIEHSADDDQGIIDQLLEGEEAEAELTVIIGDLKKDIEILGEKIHHHTSNLDKINKSQGKQIRDYKKLFLLAASDMNSFSKRVEDNLEAFQTDIQVMTRGYTEYVRVADVMSKHDTDRIRTFADSLVLLLAQVGVVKESITFLRNSTTALTALNLSKDLNKAATRQVKAIDGIISNLTEVESFALKIRFQIDEKFSEEE